jgi:hypothetical protein
VVLVRAAVIRRCCKVEWGIGLREIKKRFNQEAEVGLLS